ncbi:von Willebrand factor D and EGF domain-containing protein [Elysia marginata]|uniref:von Willebrand factor D and EGF domain-containing protein n=1 Tax=Elysia marginata TaxID=1093978 RepID=A0AAV4GY73_9GAST|nr:von Willebrand factor D and EGF domain-containing protein [Elysia marginata]
MRFCSCSSITFPTGGQLVAQEAPSHGINVWFYPGLVDFNATTGLCGSYDSNESNDFELFAGGQAGDADGFLRSWRAGTQTFSSIADGLCPQQTGQNASFQLQGFSQCLTADIAGTIQASSSFITCPLDSFFDTGADRTTVLRQIGEEPVNCGFTVTDSGFSLGTEGLGTDTTEKIVNFPDGWSEETALNACNASVERSGVSKVCNSSDLLTTDDFSRCVQDIKMTGLPASTATLIQVLKERCRASYGQSGPPDVVLNAFCPNDCSSQGTCSAGKCTCDQGFTGFDCSLNTTSNPLLTYLEPQICNTLTDPCTSVVVYGNGFTESSLSCFFYKLQSSLSNFEVTGPSEASTKVTYISSSQVVCQVPESGNYLITVSTTGQPDQYLVNDTTNSNWLLFIGTDRSCFTCGPMEGSCTQRTSTCFINNVCYQDLELNPVNRKQLCNSTNDQAGWSNVTAACSGSTVSWKIDNGFALALHNSKTYTNVSSINKCQGLCSSDIDLPCGSVDFDSIGLNCHLSQASTTTAGDYLLPLSGFQHADLICPDDPCESKQVYWTTSEHQIRGSVIAENYDVWSLQECRNYCVSNDSCNGIAFESTHGVCLLMTLSSNNQFDVEAPRWISEFYTCRNDSDSSSSYKVATASVVPSFGGPGQDMFTCDFSNVPEQNSQLQYNVLWNLNGEFISENAVDSPILPKNFSDIANGDVLQCAVSVCEKQNCESTRGPLTFSSLYKAEIQVTTFTNQIIGEGEMGEVISLKATAPPYVLCRGKLGSSDECSIEIRSFYRKCAAQDSVSCNCAVAIQAGDDVVIFDKCGPSAGNTGSFYPMSAHMFRRGILTPGFRILSQYEGREYKVIFPSGTIVYVERSAIKSYHYINIWIKPSPLDLGQTDGLCGRYDLDSSNDLSFANGTVYNDTSENLQPIDYMKSWRVDPANTLYTGSCYEGKDGDYDVDSVLTYCQCSVQGEDACAADSDRITCPYMEIGKDPEFIQDFCGVKQWEKEERHISVMEYLLQEAISKKSGKLLNGVNINNIRYDTVILAESEKQLQVTLDRIVVKCKEYEMEINVKKTKTMQIGRDTKALTITVGNAVFLQVSKYSYLRHMIT